jgi:FAD synthetase
MKVLVGGTFNRIHEGHLFFFRKAREFGDYLIVVISSNETARRNKDYPVKDQLERKKQVEDIDIVDKAVLGDPDDFYRVVAREKPDVIVLGYDQKMSEDAIRKRLLELGLNCDVKRLNDHLKGFSTRKMEKRKRA